MGKWLWRIIVTISLLLCAAVVGLWVWSYRSPVSVTLSDRPNSTWFLHAERGRLALVRQWMSPAPPPGWRGTTSRYGEVRVEGYGANGWMSYGADDLTGRLGFGHAVVGASVGLGGGSGMLRFRQNATYWMAPFWALLVVFGVLPAIEWSVFSRKRRRRASGACVHCGYDLRATPGRCPECGAVGPLNLQRGSSV